MVLAVQTLIERQRRHRPGKAHVAAETTQHCGQMAAWVQAQQPHDNLPSLTEVPLFGLDGAPTGGTVLVPLDELDTLFNVSLVVNF